MKYCRIFLFLTLLISIGQILDAQIIGNNRFNQWYFGDHWTLDFNYDPPLHTKSSAMSSFEGSASIADQNGNLLFYTNGEKIWNRNNQVMPNGSGLLGDEAAAMPALIVPVIGNRKKYYVFTTDGSTTDPSNGPLGRFDGLHYSIVDMELNGGLGDVVPGAKNVYLVDSTTERIIAMDGANDREYWVITQLHASRVYYAYKVDCNGVSQNPIVSNVGLPLIQLFFGIESYGYMKPNHAGTMVASVVSDPAFSGLVQRIQLMDFDPFTGIFSNPRLISGTANAYYGIEFSPNDSVLYVGDFIGKKILNYQVYAPNVQATEQVVHSYSGFGFDVGAMQLAPNGKIYIRRTGKLDHIANPDNYSNPGFQADVVNLISPPLLIATGLPTFFDIWPPELVLPDTTICWGDSINLGVNTIPGFSYTWHPGTWLSDSSIPDPLAYPRNDIEYMVVASNGFCFDTAKFNIKVLGDSLYIESSTGSFDWCPTHSMELSITSGDCLQWIVNGSADPADTLNSIAVTETGLYRAAVINPCGRIDTVEATVYVTPPVAITNPLDSVRICPGEKQMLIGAGGQILRWKFNGNVIPGENKVYLFAEKAGVYEVVVSDTCNLLDSAQIVLRYYQKPTAVFNVKDSLWLCPGSDTIITAGGGTVVDWLKDGISLGLTDSTLLINQGGAYSAIVSNNNACLDTGTVFVTYLSPATQLITERDTSICRGDTLRLHSPAGGVRSWSPAALFDCDTCRTAALFTTRDTMVRLRYTASEGCTFEDSIQISILSLPALTVSADIALCPGDSALLSVSGAQSYLWNSSAWLSCDTCSLTWAFPGQSETVSVTGWGSNGCRSTDSVDITVYPKPQLSLTGPDTVCFRELVQWTASGADSFSWSSNALSCLDCPAPTWIAKSSETIEVIGINNTGCRDTIRHPVFVFAPGSIKIAGDSTLCFGDTTVLGLSTPAPMSQISWSPQGIIDCVSCDSVKAFPVTDTFITVAAVTTDACQISDTIRIHILPLPKVLAGSDTTLCEGSVLSLSASGADQYRWQSAHALSCMSCPQSQLKAVFSENILLYGTDQKGCTGTDTLKLQVLPAPSIIFSGDTAVCPEDTFSVQATGLKSYQWTGPYAFDCDTCSNVRFTVSAEATIYLSGPGYNSCPGLDSLYVRIIPPSMVFFAADTSICEGDSSRIELSGVQSVSWNAAADIACDTCLLTAVYPDKPVTLYTEYLAVNQCRYRDSIRINVHARPKISFQPSALAICRGEIAEIQASSDIDASFKWSVAGLNACDTCPSLNFRPDASVKVYLTARSEFLCETVDSVFVDVHPLPAQFIASKDSICPDEPFTLKANAAYTLFWSGDSALSCNQCDSPVIRINEPVMILALARDSLGCEGMDTVLLTPYQKQELFAAPDTSICENDSIRVHAMNHVSYFWYPAAWFDDPSSPSPLAFPNDSSWIYVRAKDAHACSSLDSLFIAVSPAPDAYAGKDTSIFKGMPVKLSGSGGVTYLWRPSNQFADPNQREVVAFPPPGENIYILEVKNEIGCRGFDSIRVSVLIPEELRVPNAFSPNGDGVNDLFYLPNLHYYQLLSMEVYNRWGHLVYSSKDNSGWDGRYAGSRQSAGTYIYVIHLIEPGGREVIRKGNITLIR